MKTSALIAGVLGLALAVFVLVKSDIAEIMGAFASLGQPGFAWVCCFYLLPVLACALAMQALVEAPRVTLHSLFWSRMCRNAGSELLVFFPMVGEILAVRVLALLGMTTSAATALVVVDVTMELLAQILFSVIGLAFAVSVLNDTLLYWCAGGLALLTILALAFIAAQHKNVFTLLDTCVSKLAPNLPISSAGMGRTIHGRLRALWGDRARLYWSIALHLGGWILGAAEAWLALALMGLHPSLISILALESLVFAVRSVAFVVPSALGVQEGAYVALAAAFGFAPETMLAVSLIKRGRSIVLGAPCLIGWQIVEARRMRRKAKKK